MVNMKQIVQFTGFLTLMLVISGLVVAQSAKTPPINPEAVNRLRAMADYIGDLKQFSATVVNMREDTLESGHRVDFQVATKLIVSRPNKIKAERMGYQADQVFYYNGDSLTLYRPSHNVYATVAAPTTIEGVIDFARDSLGIDYPVSDLVYSNAFPLLIQDVNVALVIGKEVIGGVKCDHLLFSRPGVDFQVWIPDSGAPLPRKYIVTDTGTPELLSITSLISDWNTAPAATDVTFTFVPPKGAKAIEFLRIK